MCKKLVFWASFMLALSLMSDVQADVITIGCDADTYIQNDVVRGDSTFMYVAGGGINVGGYLRFDLAAHHVVSVQSATLTLVLSGNATRNDTLNNGRFSLYGLNNVPGNTPQDWNEMVLTGGDVGVEWTTNNGNPLINVTDLDDDVPGISEDIVQTGATYYEPGGTTVTVSGTALVNFIQSRIDDDGLVTFILRDDDTADRGYGITTKENPNEDWRPKLELTAMIGAKTSATKPNPDNGAEDVPRDVILSWVPGDYADTHDVYVGTDVNDVSAATLTDDPSGVYLGRSGSSFFPETGKLRLDFDQTYYWRVDEVNAPPDSTIYPGPVWSFTTEPFVISVPGVDIIATASSNMPGQGPENTINGSGLDANDLHSKATNTMWLSASSEPGSAWIQYEFDKPYELYQMFVWNYNGESVLSLYGLKEVAVEYSLDGENWMRLDSISEFARAPAADGYAVNTTVDFDGVAAKYVKITATSNWSGVLLDQYGLSEVRFMIIPVSARQPSPADESTGVAVNAALSWRAGREATEHNVYFSDDMQAVIDGTAPVATVSQASYGPLSLDLGRTYYWRVDEVNNAETTTVWPGNTWSLTASESLVVDDFESYNDIPEGEQGSNLVYLTWIDGYDNPSTNGSTMGNPSGNSMETTIVHGGRQSVPVFYDNTTAQSSEVTASTDQLAVGHNWTVGAPESLVLWIYGDPNNAATDRMYVKVNSSKVIYDGDLAQTGWQDWSIDLASLGINLSNVTTLTIGFERTGGAGGSGMVFIDDIWLFAAAIVEQ
jgi:hypothetical protein